MSETVSVRDEIHSLLQSIKDEGSKIDTGFGMDSADLWVTVGGVEFYIQIKRSNFQKCQDMEAAQ